MKDIRVDLPEGTDGAWRVEKYEVSRAAAQLETMRAAFNPGRGRSVPEGTYTRLMRGGTVVMSDTPDEISDHYEPIRMAHSEGGEVLINGLGIGMVAAAILDLDNVERVTVIDRAPEVIRLVGPTLMDRYGDRLSIIEADAMTWKAPKGVRYTVVWHDIWDHITSENLPQMKTLHRRYGRRCEWQGSWCRGECERMRRDDRDDRRMYGMW